MIGGGEPFLRRDLFQFLAILDSFKDLFTLSIMTNGSFITEETAKRLKKIKVLRRIQLSLEGFKDSNDDIRGEGSFEKIVNTIKLLKKYNIPTRVSLTLTRKNLSEIERLAAYLKESGASFFGMRRFVPIGRGEQLKQEMLSPLELREYYRKRTELKKKLDEPNKFMITYGCEDGILCGNSKKHSFHCGIVRGHHLNIISNGDILACRRLPFRVGNALKEDLLNIHFTSDKLYEYRNLDNAHPLCKKCSHFKHCLGGAKCITSAYFGTPFAPDPQCWRLFKELPDPLMFNSKNTKRAKD